MDTTKPIYQTKTHKQMKPIDKITKAKIQLLLSQPFFSTLLLPMEIKEDPTVKQIATDGKTIKYNAGYIDRISADELKGLLCAAVMKIAHFHHLRRSGRDQTNWNKATDLAINPIIVNAKMALPSESLIDNQYANMSAEQIFSMIPAPEPTPDKQQGQQPDPNGSGQGQGQGEDDDDQDQDSDGDQNQDNDGEQDQDNDDQNQQDDKDPGAGIEVQDSPTAKTDTQKKEEEAKIKQQLAQAAAVAKKRGTMPGELQQLVENLLKAKVNWIEVLARFITDVARNDYTFTRPNARYLHTGFFLPSLYNEEPGNVIFILDVSGSVMSVIDLVNQFAGELQEVCQFIKSPLTVIYVNTEVTGTQEIEHDEPVKLDFKAGGGTYFSPGFNYIAEHGLEPKAVVYLTDGDCNEYPERAPDYPVLWAVYNNNNFNPPFGEVIEVN